MLYYFIVLVSPDGKIALSVVDVPSETFDIVDGGTAVQFKEDADEEDEETEKGGIQGDLSVVGVLQINHRISVQEKELKQEVKEFILADTNTAREASLGTVAHATEKRPRVAFFPKKVEPPPDRPESPDLFPERSSELTELSTVSDVYARWSAEQRMKRLARYCPRLDAAIRASARQANREARRADLVLEDGAPVDREDILGAVSDEALEHVASSAGLRGAHYHEELSVEKFRSRDWDDLRDVGLVIARMCGLDACVAREECAAAILCAALACHYFGKGCDLAPSRDEAMKTVRARRITASGIPRAKPMGAFWFQITLAVMQAESPILAGDAPPGRALRPVICALLAKEWIDTASVPSFSAAPPGETFDRLRDACVRCAALLDAPGIPEEESTAIHERTVNLVFSAVVDVRAKERSDERGGVDIWAELFAPVHGDQQGHAEANVVLLECFLHACSMFPRDADLASALAEVRGAVSVSLADPEGKTCVPPIPRDARKSEIDAMRQYVENFDDIRAQHPLLDEKLRMAATELERAAGGGNQVSMASASRARPKTWNENFAAMRFLLAGDSDGQGAGPSSYTSGTHVLSYFLNGFFPVPLARAADFLRDAESKDPRNAPRIFSLMLLAVSKCAARAARHVQSRGGSSDLPGARESILRGVDADLAQMARALDKQASSDAGRAAQKYVKAVQDLGISREMAVRLFQGALSVLLSAEEEDSSGLKARIRAIDDTPALRETLAAFSQKGWLDAATEPGSSHQEQKRSARLSTDLQKAVGRSAVNMMRLTRSRRGEHSAGDTVVLFLPIDQSRRARDIWNSDSRFFARAAENADTEVAMVTCRAAEPVEMADSESATLFLNALNGDMRSVGEALAQ